MKQKLKILLKIVGFLLLLLLILTLLIRLERVQKVITDVATSYLSDYLKTEVSVGHIYTNFINNITLGDVIIEDLHGDTLLHVGDIKLKIQLSALLKNHIRVKSVDIEKPTLYIHRFAGENEFNFQFIIDKFSSNDTTKTVMPKMIIDLKYAHISWLNLKFIDEKLRTGFTSSFSKLSVSKINYLTKKNELLTDAIILDDAKISLTSLPEFNFPADSLLPYVHDKIEKIVKNENTQTDLPFKASLNNLIINNASFSYDNQNFLQRCDGIDYNHVSVSNIILNAQNILFKDDSLKVNIQQISATEQNGFKLNHLKANFLMTTNTMEFQNLLIETPYSNISDYYSMSYNSLIDFKDYLNSIVMNGNFKKSKISFKDINYFARVLNKIEHNTVMFEGHARGTVSNLKCRNIVIEAGKATRFNGNVDLIGLPNIKETFISANLDKMRTDINDVKSFYKGIDYPKELDKLGLTRISGKFDGFINDFVADAQFLTQIGVVNSDINFKFKNEIENASYSGNLSTLDFDIGALINNNLIGRTSLKANISGSGVTLKSLESEIKGGIQKIIINDYAYNDIQIDGAFTKSTFIGSAIANDPNAQFTFNGEIDMSDSIPLFNFSSDIEYLNFKNLNLLNDDISLSSKLNLNFSGRNIDELVGLLDIKDTKIKKGSKNYTIKNIQLESIIFEDEETKKIIFESDVLNAEVRGRINFKDINITLQYFFNKYFKKNVLELDPAKKAQYAQNFDFYLNINNHTNDLTELLSDNLKNIGQTAIHGNFNSEKNSLSLNATSKSVDVGDFQFRHIDINSNGTPEMIFLNSKIDSLFYDDSLFTNNIRFSSKLIRDTVVYSFFVQDSLDKNRLHLNGIIQSDLKSVTARFINSTVYFNNDPWNIPDNNSIYFDGKILDINHLNLIQNEHRVGVTTNLDPDSNTHLIVTLNDMLMTDILNAVPQLKRYKIKCHADGTITVLNVLKNPIPMAEVTFDSLLLDDELLGQLTVKSKYNSLIQKVNLNALLTGQNNDVSIEGFYNLAPKDNALLFEANIKKLSLAPLRTFISTAVSNLEGNANGILKLSGTSIKPVLQGKINLSEASATVDYLNLHLNLKDETIIFKENMIDLDKIIVSDIHGNTAKASGKIKHEYFKKFFFDIEAQTDKYELMNTSAASSSQFYGKAYGSAKMIIRGPANDLNFDIEAVTQKNTKVSIAVTDSKDISEYSFYRFVEKDAEGNVKQKVYAKKVSGINFNVNVTATPDAEIDLVLNSSQGDVITAKGDGDLKIIYDKYGELSILGNYTVSEGEYLFSMQNVISKKFQINKGSQIVWAGNPTDAKLAISAVYKLRASPYDLIEDIVKTNNDKLQQARIRVLVYLLLNIGGTISNPEVSFDINIPDADPAIKSALQSKLDFIRLEQNELNKQVVGLLVLNKFLPVYSLGVVGQATGNEAASIATGASNTVSEFVTNQLSIYLSDWLSKFVTDVQLDIGYRTYQNDLNNGSSGSDNPDIENRRELQLALSKSFFNDRIYVDVGGNFDFSGSSSSSGNNGSGGTPQNGQRGNNVAGDFEIQYALTPDGRYKIKAFRRGEYDIFSERNRNKTGVGIQYKKEFDNWKELIHSGRNKKSK